MAEGRLGGCRDQVVGQNCRFMQGPLTDRVEVARLKEAMAEKRPVTVRLLNYKQDGTKFWNNLHVAPIRNADGEVLPLPTPPSLLLSSQGGHCMSQRAAVGWGAQAV